MQEMHVREGDEYLLKGLFKGAIYHSSALSPTRGVLLEISHSTAWKDHETVLDGEGGYIILYGSLDR